MKKLLWIFVLSFFLFACNEQVEKEQWNLVMTQPAQIWEECFPLGNGHLGMMPDGGIEKETIVLNDITLWSGAPSDDSNPKALESLPEIQRLLKEGKNDVAQNLMYETFVCGGAGSGRVSRRLARQTSRTRNGAKCRKTVTTRCDSSRLKSRCRDGGRLRVSCFPNYL